MNRWAAVIKTCDLIFSQRHIIDEDFKQDMYIYIYEKSITKFKGDIHSNKFRNWVSVICKNQSINRLKRYSNRYSFIDFYFLDQGSDFDMHNRIKEYLEDIDSIDSSLLKDKIVFEDRFDFIKKKKQKLSKQHQRIFDMKMRGLSIREISEIEGIKEMRMKTIYYDKILPRLKPIA